LSEYAGDYNTDAMERAGAVGVLSKIDGVGRTVPCD
jgi:hypothetical protein